MALGSVVLGARIVLAGVFAVAGAAKLADRDGSRNALAGFGVPTRLARTGAVLLPLAELATAIALVPAGSARWGAVAALILLAGFIAGIANAMRRGRAPDCHCFGQIHSAPAGRSTLARNGALAVLSGLVIAEGPGPELASWVEARTAAELVAVVSTTAAIVLGVVAFQLWRERGIFREALEGSETRLRNLPLGLPVGSVAPEFSLPDLSGNVHSLQSLRTRGRPVVLIFVSDGCGPCLELYPEIGRWQASLADEVTIALVARTGADEAQAAVQEHGLRDMLLQRDMEVMETYRARATPAAVAISPDGKIASSTVSSAIPIEPLIRLTLERHRMSRPAPAAAAGPTAT